MMLGQSTSLERIATLIEQHIEELERLGLHSTAKLLRITRLDLKMRMHSISDTELRGFCEALEDNFLSKDKVVEFQRRAAKHRRA